MLGLNSSTAEIQPAGLPALDRRFPVGGFGPVPNARTPLSALAEPGLCPNRCARWALGEGLRAGDAVALLTRDSIRIAPLRHGLDLIGIRVVSLDADQREAALAASLSASRATLLIADTALAAAYAGVMGRLAAYPVVWWNGPGADFSRFDLALAELDGAPLRAGELRP